MHHYIFTLRFFSTSTPQKIFMKESCYRLTSCCFFTGTICCFVMYIVWTRHEKMRRSVQICAGKSLLCSGQLLRMLQALWDDTYRGGSICLKISKNATAAIQRSCLQQCVGVWWRSNSAHLAARRLIGAKKTFQLHHTTTSYCTASGWMDSCCSAIDQMSLSFLNSF